jgi:hypothetical protein
VVDLVLHAYGKQIVGLELERFAFFVQGANFHTLGARHLLVDSGYGQAAFLVHLLAVAFEDLGVDQRHQAGSVLADVDDDHALMHIDLGGGQPDAGCLVHGFGHVLHELAEFVIYLGDRFCNRVQKRIGVTEDR